MRPLQWLQQHPAGEGRARQIFLLTDGEISNVDEVMDLCRSMATSARIFSFGLGHSPSRSLVKGLARATNGRFVFIPPNSSVDSHVGEQLEKALQSCITNVNIRWNVPHAILTAPRQTPPVYANDRLIFYGLAVEAATGAIFDQNASVELYTDEHRISEAKITRIPHVTQDGTIARLAAKALILELQHSKLPAPPTVGSTQSRFKDLAQPDPKTVDEEKERVKKRILELSLKYKILSPHTAFVGVEKRADGNNAGMVLREVPIEISADDQHMGGTGRGFMPMLKRRAMPTSSLSASSFNMLMMAAAPCARSSGSRGRGRGAMAKTQVFARESAQERFSPQSAVYDDVDVQMELSSACAIRRDRSRERSSSDADEWPTGDENIVRHLISKQKFDGLWDLDRKHVEKLTGAQLDRLPRGYDEQTLISAIIVVLLETRYQSFSSMWYGVVQKARKRLMRSFGDDMKKLDDLLSDVRQVL